MANAGKSLKQRAYHEFKGFLILAFYLWLVLGLLEAYKSVILAENHIDYAAHGIALINALVLGKFMFIVKALNPAKRAEDAPLIYPTLLKAGIFAVVLMVLKILEDVAVGYFHGKSFVESIEVGGGSWKGILIITGIGFVMLIPLTGFGELQRVIGRGTLQDLFLRHRDLTKQFGQQAV